MGLASYVNLWIHGRTVMCSNFMDDIINLHYKKANSKVTNFVFYVIQTPSQSSKSKLYKSGCHE